MIQFFFVIRRIKITKDEKKRRELFPKKESSSSIASQNIKGIFWWRCVNSNI
jgi:hypothetical protein